MATDVAAFAKQLKEEGIEAARRETETILAEARTEAAQIIAEAQVSSEKSKREAAEEIARHRRRSEAELKLVARDLILSVKRQIEQVAASLLKEKVVKTLSTEEVVREALMELLKNQKTGNDFEIALGPALGKPLAQAVVDDLFKSGEAHVRLSEGLNRAGFELRSGAGTEVVEVTDESVTEAFRRLLSQELQRILDSKIEVAK